MVDEIAITEIEIDYDPTNADPTLAIFYDVQPNDSEQGDGK